MIGSSGSSSSSGGSGGGYIDLDAADSLGRTALIFASMHEDMDGVAARLIEAGAALNAVAAHGVSALMVACANARGETALLIINRGGAALELENDQGETALDIARRAGLEGIAMVLHEERVMAERRAGGEAAGGAPRAGKKKGKRRAAKEKEREKKEL